MTTARTRNADLQIVFNDLKRKTSSYYPNLLLDSLGNRWKVITIDNFGGETPVIPDRIGRYSKKELIVAIESFLLGIEFAQKLQ